MLAFVLVIDLALTEHTPRCETWLACPICLVPGTDFGFNELADTLSLFDSYDERSGVVSLELDSILSLAVREAFENGTNSGCAIWLSLTGGRSAMGDGNGVLDLAPFTMILLMLSMPIVPLSCFPDQCEKV